MSINSSTGLHLGVNTLFFVPGDVGGTETYLRELLMAIVQEYPGLKLTLFTNMENDPVFRKIFAGYASVRFICLRFKASFRPMRIFLEQMLLPLMVAKSRVDVLWSPGYTAPFWSSCPQVVTIHDLQYKSHPEDLSWLERLTLDTLVRIACWKCRAVIAVSEFSRRELVSYDFATPEKVHVVLEGVDQAFAIPVTDKAVLADLGKIIDPGKPYILCVAHTYPHKNVHLLVEAFARIQDRISHNLIIVGKPRLGEPAMQAAVKRLPVASRLIRLQQGVSFDLLRLLYQKADIFVLPSTYEGFGLPVLEAMMAGTPVIAVRQASLPEVGGTHVTYVEVSSADMIADTLLESLDCKIRQQQTAVKDAQKWATSFTWEKAARETVKIILSVSSSERRIICDRR